MNSYNRNLTVLWVAVLMVLPAAAVVFAGDAASNVKGTELLTPVQQRMQQDVSVDFRETPIEDVLRILARQADVDIIKSPRVTGTVTATLTDVPLSEALDNILSSQGYAYVATANMLRVIPREEIIEVNEKMVSRVLRITYADVKDVEQALKKFISEKGSISANPGTSNIIVTDTESKISAIVSFVDEIDRITPQIQVEAKIYDISSKDRFDLGVEWQAGTASSYGEIATGTTLGDQYGSLSNALYGETDGGFLSQTTPHMTGAFNGSVQKATDTDALFRFGILNKNINLDAAIRAAREDVRAKLLANPRIMVLDNQQAEIKIVEQIPYQELTETSSGGSIGTTQFRDVGVELKVIPHLTRDGLIRLIINPKFSVVTGDVVIPGTNLSNPQPIVASREAMTTALIKDGQTVVIGGLKKQDISQQKNKVPLLGDLPLIGGLFRFEGESTVNSELVVFITPSIVTEPTLSEREKTHLENTVFPPPNVPEPRIGKKVSKK